MKIFDLELVQLIFDLELVQLNSLFYFLHL